MKNISEGLIVQVNSDQTARLMHIDEENYAEVALKVKDDLALQGFVVTDDYLERGIYALKQYYAIAMLDPANAHAVTRPIDPFWHSHILFTSQYRAFCDKIVGEYMDHVPLNKNRTDQVANVRQLYNYTLKTLPKLFSGTDIDEVFWPCIFTDAELICFHKGNTDIYLPVQVGRLFEPTPDGSAWAYAQA